MNGADEQRITEVLDRLVPVPSGWTNEPISLPRFWALKLPASYVFLRDDRSVPEKLYRQMSARLVDPRIVECDGPHGARLTNPQMLADALVAGA